MPIYKCKVCGGNLRIVEGQTICECEYCGTTQTIPNLKTEKLQLLYERASNYLLARDFDKAYSVYEQILIEDNKQADVYWSMVLCKYGIEYVEDNHSKKRIPTINRLSFDSILNDYDYLKALEYADKEERDLYESEAKIISEIQKRLINVISKEEPYDVFICYKETDEKGRRTEDSVIAQNLYEYLTKNGYRVFFSKISLEDKIGQSYEPYIYAALNSAKVMLVVSTSLANLNSVWVKNEWARYLDLVRKNSDKYLIPVYKNMDVKELPDELIHLQCQDASKIAYEQDILTGIRKLINKDLLVEKTIVEKEKTKKFNFKFLLIPVIVALIAAAAWFVIDNRVTIEDDLSNARVGDIIEFGKYEQDNSSINGKEKIEWIVLEKDNNNAVLLSKYVIDAGSYYTTNSYVTWDDSNLKDYLLNVMYDDMFSSKEKNYVRGNIRLLSVSKAKECLDSVSSRTAVATDFAISKGIKLSSSYGNCDWWVVPDNEISKYVAKVNDNGSINSKVDSVVEMCGIRPVIEVAINGILSVESEQKQVIAEEITVWEKEPFLKCDDIDNWFTTRLAESGINGSYEVVYPRDDFYNSEDKYRFIYDDYEKGGVMFYKNGYIGIVNRNGETIQNPTLGFMTSRWGRMIFTNYADSNNRESFDLNHNYQTRDIVNLDFYIGGDVGYSGIFFGKDGFVYNAYQNENTGKVDLFKTALGLGMIDENNKILVNTYGSETEYGYHFNNEYSPVGYNNLPSERITGYILVDEYGYSVLDIPSNYIVEDYSNGIITFVETRKNMSQCPWGFENYAFELNHNGNNSVRRIYVNTNGEIISDRYKDGYGFYDDLAAVCENGKWGYINKEGKVVVDFIFDKTTPTFDGKAWVLYEGKAGILNVKELVEKNIDITLETLNKNTITIYPA